MYIIKNGLPPRFHWLAGIYCFLGLVASFGVGNATQINTVIRSIQSSCLDFGVAWSNMTNIILGLMFALMVGLLLGGGSKRIGRTAQLLVPFAAVGYLMLCVFVLCSRASQIPRAFSQIVKGAFSPGAITGGVVGSIFLSLRTGACRGVFTNEAGMGTAAIAHAGADVAHPVEQGYMGIIEVFVDTILICTMTALVILCSGVSIPYGTDPGVLLTNDAFSAVCGPWVRIFISASLCLFALATVLGWGLYGGRCAQYLFGDKSWKRYVIAQMIVVIISAVLRSEYLWVFSELLNGLMAIPNLFALMLLIPVLKRLLKEYTSEKFPKP